MLAADQDPDPQLGRVEVGLAGAPQFLARIWLK